MIGSFELEIALRLGAAALLGGLIGLEREKHGRPAGLRTHILVSVGSALVMLISIYGFLNIKGVSSVPSYDPGRLAAQVVSGIGFLGAGTILREGASIKGLTTAASLWVVAGIGLGVGAGFYFGSVIATGIVIFALILLDKLEKGFLASKQMTLSLQIYDQPGRLAQIASVFGNRGINISSVDISERENGRVSITIGVEAAARSRSERNLLVQDLASLDGVIQVRYDD